MHSTKGPVAESIELVSIDLNLCMSLSVKLCALRDCWCLKLAQVAADISIHGDKGIGDGVLGNEFLQQRQQQNQIYESYFVIFYMYRNARHLVIMQ